MYFTVPLNWYAFILLHFDKSIHRRDVSIEIKKKYFELLLLLLLLILYIYFQLQSNYIYLYVMLWPKWLLFNLHFSFSFYSKGKWENKFWNGTKSLKFVSIPNSAFRPNNKNLDENFCKNSIRAFHVDKTKKKKNKAVTTTKIYRKKRETSKTTTTT